MSKPITGPKMPNKVLHLIDSGGFYGAEKMLLSLVSSQLNQGLNPLILSVGKAREAEKQIEFEANQMGLPIKVWRMSAGFNFLGMLGIIKFAKREGFDLYHSHGYKFNVLLGLVPKRFRGAPVLSTIHGYVMPPHLSKMGVYLFLDRFFLSRLDKVVFVNSLMLSQSFFSSLELKNSYVIENGIDLDVSFHVTKLSEGDKKIQGLDIFGPVIGFVGRLSNEKGIGYLVDAFYQMLSDTPDAILLICGDGPLKAELLEKVHRLGIANKVMITGFIGDVKSAMEKMDVFVIPSLTEGMPIVLLEAMALGKSIIATKVGGMPNMLDQGLAGHLVDPKDVRGMVESLTSMLSGSTETDAFALAAKEKFNSCYDSSNMAINYLSVYQELVI